MFVCNIVMMQPAHDYCHATNMKNNCFGISKTKLMVWNSVLEWSNVLYITI